MRSLAYISCFLLLVGCARKPIKGLAATAKESSTVSLLDGEYGTAIFRSSLSYKENKFSGLFIAKKQADGSMLMTLTPKVGPKIFDFEFDPQGEFIVHYCFESMNRPIVLKMLEGDLRLLLGQQNPIKKETWYTDEANQRTVCQVKSNKSVNYYFVDDKTGNLAVSKKYSMWGREKVVINYLNHDDQFPSTIELKHQHIPLSLSFKLMKKK